MISGSSVDWRTDPQAVKKYQFIYHFLPHPVENRRATLLQEKSILIYCLLILAVTLSFRVIPLLLPGVLGYASNINVSDLLKNTNAKRNESGLSTLVLNDKLSAAAKKKAEHMFKHNYWAHIAPDGTEPWSFIMNEGYDYVYAGENLAKNFSSSKDVVNAWMNSPSHRENLLNKNYTEMGLAVVNGVLNGYQTTLVVQMFGKPRYTKAVVQPATAANVRAEAPAANVAPKAATTPVPTSAPPTSGVPTVTPSTLTVPEANTTPTQAEEQTGGAVNETPVPNAEVQPLAYQEVQMVPKIDVRAASKTLSLIFSGFMATLLLLDIWYSRKMGIVKVNGHTLAHVTFLLVVMISIWFVLRPGAVL
jgi:hypothetical protein